MRPCCMASTDPPATSPQAAPTETPSQRAIALAVLVAALGYFVDIYDLILFGVIGKKSLVELGVPAANLDATIGRLLDLQMAGMLVGGVVWGVLGDRKGRLSVLFGSILMYSLANLANGAIASIEYYGTLRFVAGIGLAGELGAGVTLVSEIMSKQSRGWGTTVIAGVGLCGAIAAALIDRVLHWRAAYYLGGGMGLGLLVLRVGVRESGMFESVKHAGEVVRGNFLQIFSTRARATRYLLLILSGTPIWYAIGILTIRAGTIARSMGLTEEIVSGTAVLVCYSGIALGDVTSGVMSQLLGSRKRAIAAFIVVTALAASAYFTVGRSSATALYSCCFLLGIGSGYWAVFVTMASEQFGTNLRSTVTTTAPNFVRGSLVVLNLGFTALQAPLGVWGAALAVGVVCITIALLSVLPLEETFGRDLDFVERD
jgi:putative MFS transporter